METTERKFFTVSKADVFHKELNTVIFSVEASHSYHRAITFETKNLVLLNAINKVEHASAKDARMYVESLSQAHHDEIQLRKEQGI